MNQQKFLEEWRTYGPTKQLAILLAAILRNSESRDGQLMIPLADLADVADSPVEPTIICREAGDKIHLLYSSERVTLFEIQDSVHERTVAPGWPQMITTPVRGPLPTDYANSLNSLQGNGVASVATAGAVKSDADLADLEDRSRRLKSLREKAGSVRTRALSPSRTPHRRPPSPAETQAREQETISRRRGDAFQIVLDVHTEPHNILGGDDGRKRTEIGHKSSLESHVSLSAVMLAQVDELRAQAVKGDDCTLKYLRRYSIDQDPPLAG
jgi:hypothetical protein